MSGDVYEIRITYDAYNKVLSRDLYVIYDLFRVYWEY